MPTPTIYASGRLQPFADVPASLQGDTVSVLYVTDRAPDHEPEEPLAYGDRRSRSAAFGSATVQFGPDLTWDELVAASTSAKRAKTVEIAVVEIEEAARFGPVPPMIVVGDARMAAAAHAAPPDPLAEPAAVAFLAELEQRLAKTPSKEVFLYVHGFANTFEDAVLTCAEVWHFLGRQGVPVCYSWPAASGLFRGYEYTVDSTQFTIQHFKRFMRLLASCPDVERINVLAHSRGTAVATDGVRELFLELRSISDVRESMKLGRVALAAPDIDLDVAIARNAAERVGMATEAQAIYISDKDKALGFSSWLSGGMRRLGAFDPEILTPEEVNALRGSQRLQIIDARVSSTGPFGHSYFHHSPIVSSDLILFMRYGLPAGGDGGRPLGVSKEGLWLIEDDYPGEAWTIPSEPG